MKNIEPQKESGIVAILDVALTTIAIIAICLGFCLAVFAAVNFYKDADTNKTCLTAGQ